MVFQIVFGTIAALVSLLSIVFGGNLLTRFIQHSNELAITKHILDETQRKLTDVIRDVAELKNSSIETVTRVDLFIDSIKKLDLIPALDAKMTAMEKLVVDVQALVMTITQDRLNRGK